MEIFAGCSNRSTDSEHQSKKMGVVRSRFEKNAIRVCGDWSEQLSSKGKIYFYNCITEVSQWQKPSEWNLPDLEHNELIKVLSQRDSLDSNVMKRPRVMCNTASVKKDDFEASRVSPKRSKTYEQVDNEKHYLPEDRSYLQRNLCSHTPKSRPPLRQRGYRDSPKNDCNGSSNRATQYCNSSNSHSKRDPSISLQRPAPADDMEISPNSSPLSGGSSPMGYDASHSPKRVKYRHVGGHKVPRRAPCADIKNPSRSADKTDDSSHTLRQLIDAIRDSIGGLLDQSPRSTSNQKIRASNSANGLHLKQVPSSNEKISSSLNLAHTSRAVDKVAKAQSVRHGRNPPTECHDEKFLHSSESSVAQSQVSTLPSSSVRLNAQEKGMSGLVSTLSTLVNLIGTRNTNNQPGGGDNCSTHTSQMSTVRQPFIRPHLLQQRFGNQPTSSPLTPSPVTPSAATGASSGGGSSGGILQNSISLVGTAQQPDDASSAPDRLALGKSRTLASTSSHDLNSPCNLKPVSPSKLIGLEVRDGHRSDSIPIDELSQSIQSTPEASTTMDYSQSEKEIRTRISARHVPTGSASPSNRQNTGTSKVYSPTTSQSSVHKSLPVTGIPRDPTDKRFERYKSPDKHYPSLDAAETQLHVEPCLSLQYRDVATERLEGEAQTESKRFDRLHSVLYGELSAESKTLRALVRISEAKLALHKEKQSSLQELMDTIECHRHLPNPSLPDDAI